MVYAVNHKLHKVIAMVRIFIICFLLLGCVSNKAVRVVNQDDYTMNCDQLQYELTNLDAKFDEVKDESGLTGKNVGLAFLFWPGIIVNEVRSNKNQDSIDARIEHLTKLYTKKCL